MGQVEKSPRAPAGWKEKGNDGKEMEQEAECDRQIGTKIHLIKNRELCPSLLFFLLLQSVTSDISISSTSFSVDTGSCFCFSCKSKKYGRSRVIPVS